MAVERSAEENPKGGGDGRIFLRRRGEQQEDLVPPHAVPVVQGLRDRFMRILYPLPGILPDPRARFIQIVNTCHALAEAGNSVALLTGMKPGCTAEESGRIYGVRPIPNLEIVRMPILRREHAAFPRLSWHGVFHWPLLLRILRESFSGGERPVLYVRHIKLAEFL